MPRPRLGLILAAIALAVVLVGGVGAGLWMMRPAPKPSATSAATAPTVQPTIVRTTAPSAAPSSTQASGGQLGQPVPITGTTGAGTATVVSATWTNQGLTAPNPGDSYLVLKLKFTATKGQLLVGPLFVQVLDQQGDQHILSFGPAEADQLEVTLLSAGESAEGSVAFELPEGPITVQILDEALRPIANVRIGA